MAARYVFIIVSFILCLNLATGLQTVNGTIKITAGTTSACSDTVRFINDQLVDAYALYGNFIDLEFVPWGRTVRNADGTLVCQFGTNDCWANRLHRCALNMLSGDQAAQLAYMQCEFTVPLPAFGQGSYICAQSAGLRLIDVDNCVSRPSFDELDQAAEEAARVPMQIIDFVPSISFNGQHNVELHNQARTRLSNLICFALADDPSTGITSCTV